MEPTDNISNILPEGASDDHSALAGDEYEVAHGERLSETLDLGTWHLGADLVEMYTRLEREIADAVRQENEFQQRIRQEIFPRLRGREGAPADAGVYKAPLKKLEDIHMKLLFNGGVEACDGTVVTHDTLPMTITQIGVCLVSYQGDQGSWVHRIFRRDLRTSGKNPVDETLELLEKRRQRSSVDQDSPRDRLRMRTSISPRIHPSRVSQVGMDKGGACDVCFFKAGSVNSDYLTGSLGSPFLFFHTFRM